MRRVLLAAALLSMLATVGQPSGLALACQPVPTTQAERFERAAMIFQGRVVAQERGIEESVALNATNAARFSIMRTHFAVARIWKGPGADQHTGQRVDPPSGQRADTVAVITILSMCAPASFEPGREYLVWAYRLQDGRLAAAPVPDGPGNGPPGAIGPGSADYDFLEQRLREQQSSRTADDEAMPFEAPPSEVPPSEAP